MLYLYTDGSSTGRNNREWGWGWVLVSEDKLIATDCGGGPSGTNNHGELTAAIEGLAYIVADPRLKKSKVTLISDSLYCLKTASGEYTPRKNLELCKLLKNLYDFTKAEGKWVKGHSGDRFNEIADKLSKQGKALYAPKRDDGGIHSDKQEDGLEHS